MAYHKIAWQTIKKDYLFSEPPLTLHALAERHEVSISTLSKRSARDEWPRLRKEADAKTEVKLHANESDARAGVLAGWDKSHLAGAKGLQAAASRELTEILKASDPELGTKRKRINAIAVDAIGRVFERVMNIERTVHGRNVIQVQHEHTAAPADGIMVEIREALEEQGVEIVAEA